MAAAVSERPAGLGEGRQRAVNRRGPVRVAVVGCGAISCSYHIPVLAGHEGVRLAALVDRDVVRARELARGYGVKTVVPDVSELEHGSIDAAVIATPPAHHAPCCIDLARRGIHVLVEKPLAVTAADARAMAEAARASGVVLSAGYLRRLFPAVRLLRAALEEGALGGPVAFDAEEGDEYTWRLATLRNLRKDQGGGGVLIDIGSHVLDLLLYLFPGPFEVLEYGDNALGGIETDCRLRLRLRRGEGAVDGRVELSRTRKMRSTLRVVCERGTLELRTGERYRVTVVPHGVHLADPDRETPRPFSLQASWADEPETVGYEAYRAEIDDWLGAIRSGGQPLLSGDSATRTVALIEECYRTAGRLSEPWVWETVRPASPAEDGKLPAVPRRAEPGRVLITGAAGFIGCRTAEVLHLGQGWKVRALVHTPGSAARLARLPVEMVQGDLKSREDMGQAVQGCDAVVHCAVGTSYGQRREIFAVTVGGTRNLAEAARAAGVRRFVHLSSIAIHGGGVPGVLDETAPVRPTRRDDYSESKAKAERVIQKAARAGLSALVLRPGNVYGPFSRTFSIRPIQYLKKGRLELVGSADTPSNTVYVDNLVHAVVRALEAPAELADGQAFTISDGDGMTWGEFYGYFARELGAELRTAPADEAPRRSWWPGWGPLAWPGAWFRGLKAVLTSAEFRALGKRVLRTDPIGRLPRWLLERCPWLDRGLRRLVGTEATVIYRRPAPAVEDVMRVRPRTGLICIAKARRLLGYEPPVPRERALELTAKWIRHARLA
jgi:predicted dehydrogenase/nucleoside-diphosphate-sugar epimerase